MTDRAHQLRTVQVGDDPAAWASAGFAVADDQVVIANTTVWLTGPEGGRGIRAVSVDGLGGEIDGLAFNSESVSGSDGSVHPNTVTGFDHLVALSPHMARTTAALEAAGLELRRTRDFGADDDRRRQAFFWLGDVILELAGSATATGDGPATMWGLALTTDDLDGAADTLGPALGSPKAAVQSGRRIATLRTRDLDISVPIALMTPHGAS